LRTVDLQQLIAGQHHFEPVAAAVGVERGDVDAANVDIPFDLQAKKRGLNAIELPAEKFNAYLKDEGLDAALAEIEQKGVDQIVCLGNGNALALAIVTARSIFWLAQFIGTPFSYTSAIQNGFGPMRGGAYFGSGYTFGVVLSSPITGIAEMPYAPVHLDAVISGSDIVIDWDRRDRLDFSHGGGADVPLSETSELYDVIILDGVGAVKRTYTDQAPPPFTYPAADVTADWGSMPTALKFDIYQKSALVGRGFAGQATVAL
jgi:hypothetical protein